MICCTLINSLMSKPFSHRKKYGIEIIGVVARMLLGVDEGAKKKAIGITWSTIYITK